jgi:hypothetical protein
MEREQRDRAAVGVAAVDQEVAAGERQLAPVHLLDPDPLAGIEREQAQPVVAEDREVGSIRAGDDPRVHGAILRKTGGAYPSPAGFSWAAWRGLGARAYAAAMVDVAEG